MKNVQLRSEVEVKLLRLLPFLARRRNQASRCIRVYRRAYFAVSIDLLATSEEEC
jgi:hypothetical protein